MPNPIVEKIKNVKIPEPVKIIGLMILGAILLLPVIRLLYPDSDNIEIGFPDGKLSVKIANNHIDYRSLLNKVFKDEESKAGMLQWLNGKNIFEVSDPKLVDKLAEIFPSVSQSNESLVQKANRLNTLLNKYKVIKELRTKADLKESPFQYIGKKITIGIPSQEDQPRKSFVNVGFESEFRDKTILIKNPLNKKELKVRGRGAFPKVEDELFQLNNKQVQYLFSKVINTDSAVAYIVPGAKLSEY